MSYPVFATGDVLNASDMNAVGLWLVKTQTVGSGVSSVTVTGAFSSSYDNYLITYTGGSASLDTNLSMRLGSATTGYYGSLIFGNFAATTITAAIDNNNSQWTWVGGGLTGTNAYVEILMPFLTQPTEMRARVRYSTVYGQYIGHQGSSTSFSAFTIYPSAGTITGGTIRVYGYRN